MEFKIITNVYLKVAVFTALYIAIIGFMSSCSLKRELVGTWSIASYSEKGTTSKTSATNVGTLTFKKDGTGKSVLDYEILGNQTTQEGNFTYKIDEKSELVTIQSKEQNQLAKSWIIMESDDDLQKWKSTDGQGSVQELKLKKEN